MAKDGDSELPEITQVMSDTNPVRILVIDPEPCFGRSLVELFHANSFFASYTNSMDEAKAILPHDIFEIAICDIAIPKLNCQEFISFGKKHHPLFEVIFTSTKPNFKEALSAVRDGSFDYIAKERLFSVIIDKINRIRQYQFRHLIKNVVQHPEPSETFNQALPNYKIVRKIGRGASGIVLLAERDEKSYALKLLCCDAIESPRGQRQVTRFLAEAALVAQIHHPHIIKIYEYGLLQQSNVPYMLMEYIDGSTLQQCIARNTFQYHQKIRLLVQICNALQVIHHHGIVHCDIKPANIMIQSPLHAKLSDFGIARTLNAEKLCDPEIIGSPAYMAPEAFLGSSHLEPRSDIFSLGVVACELLSGERPFAGSTISAIIKSQHKQRQKISSRQFDSIPEAMRAVVAKMLQHNLHERYGSAADIIADIELACNNE